MELERSGSVDAFRAGMFVAAALALAGGLIAALRISDSEALAQESPEQAPL